MTSGLQDIIAPDLRILFCGINPAATAAEAGRHFVSRSNRFWRVLYLAGLTAEEVKSSEDSRILEYGYGLTAFISRPTGGIHDLTVADYQAARDGFNEKIRAFRPAKLVFLGKAAWMSLAGSRRIEWGRQTENFVGAEVWVVPNPSGRNLHFSLAALIPYYRALRPEMVSIGDR